jgi:hypothetical protein
MKLIKIVKSPKAAKKFRATFETDDGKAKTVDFGAARMADYTLTKDPEQRARYRERHKKDLETNDPTRAGFLSYYILWGPHTNIEQNMQAYKERFNL